MPRHDAVTDQIELILVADLAVSAASGLCRVGDDLWVVADDDLAMHAFALDGTPRRRVVLEPGELPAAHAARKAAKPDHEALCLLPDGRALALSSGSSPRRHRGACVSGLGAASGDGTPNVAPIDLAPLHRALAARIPGLNLEGAAVVGERLWLAQRGNGLGASPALIGLSLPGVLARLAQAAPWDEALIETIVPVSLGVRGGSALGLTDLAPLPDGRLVFSAAAEDTPDQIADGACVACAVGVLSTTGDVVTLADGMTAAGAPVKLEGVCIDTDAGGAAKLWLVADLDDPGQPSPLYRAVLRL